MEMLRHELQIMELSFVPLCPLVTGKTIIDVCQEGCEVSRYAYQQQIL
jgi:hypothetical protein